MLQKVTGTLPPARATWSLVRSLLGWRLPSRNSLLWSRSRTTALPPGHRIKSSEALYHPRQ